MRVERSRFVGGRNQGANMAWPEELLIERDEGKSVASGSCSMVSCAGGELASWRGRFWGGGPKMVDSRGLVQLNLGVVETRTREWCCGGCAQ